MLFDETPERAEEAAAPLSAHRAWIDACYAADTVPEIIERLRARPEADAQTAADELELLSPLGLTVTLASVRAAAMAPGLRAVLEQEYAVCAWMIEQPDLTEGIRAQVIDKDRRPRWTPATLAEVPTGVAERALSHQPAEPLWE
jgi:enoyl-CoA hydratase